MMESNKYILNVDWLTIYGRHTLRLANEKFRPKRGWEDVVMPDSGAPQAGADEPDNAEVMHFKGIRQHTFGNITLDIQEYGTRQYDVLAHVYYGDEQFGILQAYPRVSTMDPRAFHLKVANMWLYRADVWEKLDYVINVLGLQPKSISRLDIAADFNTFHGGLHPIQFISEFMSGKLKKKGRSRGHVNFSQRYSYSQKEKKFNDTLNFNALTIGKHDSDAHAYLYNKSLELDEEKMKPYIQDCWKIAGFDIKDVWRLEFSLKADALKFFDANTGMLVDFGLRNLMEPDEDLNIATLYFAMLRSLFFFFYPTGQKNVSREKALQLFDDEIEITRRVLREKNPSDRTERILIKQLQTLALRYRHVSLEEKFQAQKMACHLAKSMDLQEWYDQHKRGWEVIRLKA